MTVDAAIRAVLRLLGDGQVEALADRCEQAPTPAPLDAAVPGASPAGREAVARLAAAWAAAAPAGLTGLGVALALRVGLDGRRRAAQRRTRPVWTGPGADGEQRLTAGVLHELLAAADERILLVSYAAFTLAPVADDLEAAVARGCTVDVVFETQEDSAGQYTGKESTPYAAVDGIRRWRWPAGERPEAGAVLHAKLVVVDRHKALVGSANLTHRALHRNLEAGVLIADPAVAAALDEHVRELMRAGTLERTA